MAAPIAKRLARKALAKAPRLLARIDEHRLPSLTAMQLEATSPDVVAALRRCFWTDHGDLRLEGWSYLPGRDHKQCAVRVYATSSGLEPAWEATVIQGEDLEVNAFSAAAEDLSTTAWTATFTSSGLAAVLKALPRPARRAGRAVEFGVVVELDYSSEQLRTPLTKHYRWGSAGRIPGRAFDAEAWVAPTWRDDVGLVLRVKRTGVVTEAVEVTEQDVSLYLRSLGMPDLPGCRECRTVAASP